MHIVMISDEENFYENSAKYRLKMASLKGLKEMNNVFVYVNPDIVKDDKEYFYLLSLRDPNVEKLKKIGNRYEVDKYFEIINLLEELKSFK